MAHRKLIDGGSAWELNAPIDLIIHTKAPGKWKLIDMETGQEYIGSAEPNKYGCWIRIKDKGGDQK
jgi:hypothetical protein